MRVKAIGEFQLIQRLSRIVSPQRPSSSVRVGIGDDAAVLWLKRNKFHVVTTDTLVEGVHFDRRYSAWRSVGWKALAVNLSDLAAMGAEPAWAVASLIVPSREQVGELEDLYRGIAECSKKFQCPVVGGNVSSGRNFSITIAMGGTAMRPILRSGAKDNDVIAVTGHLGASHAGLKLLKKNKTVPPELCKKHQRPDPRLEWIRLLTKNRVKVNSAIDISDGLAADLGHLLQASRLGADLDARTIPMAIETIQTATRFKDEALDYALYGGEDYELLLTMRPKEFVKAKRILKNNIHAIGTTTRDRSVRIFSSPGVSKKLEPKGFTHF